jgi:hypothetical protein
MAAINSGLDVPLERARALNAKDLIRGKARGKVVGVIGHFPFVDEPGGDYEDLYVFEKVPREGDLTETDVPKFLPRADIVAISGTTIPNHTVERVLRHARPDSYVIMLGPTTPLSPLLFDYGIDAVCGAFVRDAESVIGQVKQATPFRHIKGVDYLTLLKEAWCD